MPEGSTPPRRRAPQKKSSSLVPLLALFLGVLVAGLGIGAALSLIGRSHATTAVAVAPTNASAPAPTDSPLPEPTESPVIAAPATPKPTHAPATPKPSTAKPAAPSPSPATASSAAVSATGTPESSLAAPVTPGPKIVITPVPAAHVAIVATPAPVIAPVAPYGGDASLSPFASRSSELVRQFLRSLIAGDEASARDDLVDDRAGLPESAVLDQDSRIRNVVAHGSGDTAEVTLVIETPGGNYNARYFLVKSSSGNPQIRAHDLSKI